MPRTPRPNGIFAPHTVLLSGSLPSVAHTRCRDPLMTPPPSDKPRHRAKHSFSLHAYCTVLKYKPRLPTRYLVSPCTHVPYTTGPKRVRSLFFTHNPLLVTHYPSMTHHPSLLSLALLAAIRK